MPFVARVILPGALIMNSKTSGTRDMQVGTNVNGNGIEGTPITPAIYLNSDTTTSNMLNIKLMKTIGRVMHIDAIAASRSSSIYIKFGGMSGSSLVSSLASFFLFFCFLASSFVDDSAVNRSET